MSLDIPGEARLSGVDKIRVLIDERYFEEIARRFGMRAEDLAKRLDCVKQDGFYACTLVYKKGDEAVVNTPVYLIYYAYLAAGLRTLGIKLK